MGDALDLWLAIQRTLSLAWPRRFDGRPIAGEPRPRAEDLIGAVSDALPAWARTRVTHEQIGEKLHGILAVGGWPFAVLDSTGTT